MLKNKYLFFLLSVSLSTVLFIFVSVNNVFASVDRISFVSEVQNLDVGQVSGPIKIQTQDQSSATTTATETIYLNLSTSGDGEFSSNKDTWKKIITLSSDFSTSSVYISSGNTSRSFYYKGLADGQHKITVSAKSKSGIVFDSIEQIINIGTSSSIACSSFTYSAWGICSSNTQTRTILTSLPSDCTGGSPVLTQSCTVDSTSTSSGTQTTKIITRTVYISTHSEEEDLSNYEEKAAFETSAGRERVALVGSPIEFNAKYNLLQKDQCVPVFRWSFGDGFDSIGKDVAHTYKYSGEYQVVLNGNCGDYNSISRTVVKVISPNISISSLSNGDMEIINNGKTEINIGNWKIKGGQKDFVFPQDTIISANNKIVLSKEDLNYGSSTERISLNNPSSWEVACFYIKNIEQQNSTSFSQAEINQDAALANSSDISVAEAERLVKEYKEKLALNEKQINKTENVKEADITIDTNKDLSDNKDIIQTASVIDSISSSSTRGFWSKLLDIPIKSVKSFAHVFYDF